MWVNATGRDWYLSITVVTDGQIQRLLWTETEGREREERGRCEKEEARSEEPKEEWLLRHVVHQYSVDVAVHRGGRLQLLYTPTANGWS